MNHTARKRFGQHFLTDPRILANIVGEMHPRPEDHVVEIGPGLGALTHCLLPHLKHLHVIEIDRDLAAKLRSEPLAAQITVHETDVLTFNFASLPSPLRVVGNLPYNISSPILFALLPHASHIVDQHFMLQKEVIDRMVAQPGCSTFGRLSVMLQAYYDMEHLFDVPPESFDPPPRVMSAIVRMVPKPQAHREAIPHAVFARIVGTAFAQKRKMIRNNWAGVVPTELSEQAGIAPTSRAEDISCAQFLEVARNMA
ncbi:MAG: 16S rRNA (adenine(1518)-N(6)/adenine(1519)-N(6))-dimethyltransferase RsmA [Limnobacter sp.]|nr:16S rRNA (adenine(1518)-N(6)/adenine(1519)-N(6))-dimethyltransferase RsmA [Limnobacter sp.]